MDGEWWIVFLNVMVTIRQAHGDIACRTMALFNVVRVFRPAVVNDGELCIITVLSSRGAKRRGDLFKLSNAYEIASLRSQ